MRGDLKRIIIHWTAGGYTVTKEALEHYHYIIDKDGAVITCKNHPKDNIDCKDGKYAAHTEMGNTGSIGVALMGMADFDLVKKQTKYPLTQKQCEKAWCFVAYLCGLYRIDITPTTVLTHYEFDANRGKKGRKIDITYLPYESNLKPDEIGNYIRNKVNWYYRHNNN